MCVFAMAECGSCMFVFLGTFDDLVLLFPNIIAFCVKNRVNEMPLPEPLGFVFIEPVTALGVACTTLQVTRDRLNNNLTRSPIFMYKMRRMHNKLGAG